MNDVEVLKRATAPVQVELTNSETPYTVSGYGATGLNVYNESTTTALTITLTLNDATTMNVTIPASTTWSENVRSFTSLATSGSTSFYIQVKGWRLTDDV